MMLNLSDKYLLNAATLYGSKPVVHSIFIRNRSLFYSSRGNMRRPKEAKTPPTLTLRRIENTRMRVSQLPSFHFVQSRSRNADERLIISHMLLSVMHYAVMNRWQTSYCRFPKRIVHPTGYATYFKPSNTRFGYKAQAPFKLSASGLLDQ